MIKYFILRDTRLNGNLPMIPATLTAKFLLLIRY